eukprot:m.204292 g.204292  ORF g.204292 m.204292 type:complete len:466 (-) comp26023_c2_seq3:595-1992(-)
MLHELLMALNGVAGDIFVDTGDTLEVDKALPFIHPSEATLLNRLCAIGWAYSRLNAFVDLPSQGLYLRACKAGLEQILGQYRQLLVDFEQEILCDPKIPLSELQVRLEPYKTLFPAILRVAADVQSQHVQTHGGQLLQHLHDRTASGVLSVQKTFLRLEHSCLDVLYRQLIAWMVYGSLLDQHQEFFIQTQEIQGAEDSWNEHQVSLELLPRFIPLRVASKILFVGKTVVLFEGNPRSASLSRRDEEHFVARLNALQKLERFDIVSFETTIDYLREQAAARLWFFLTEQADLFGFLKSLRAYFLVGNGGFCLSLLEQTRHLLDLPHSKASKQDVQAAFQRAAQQMHVEDDARFQAFTMVVGQQAKSKYETIITASDPLIGALGYYCDVPWPLQLLFSQATLQQYGDCFVCGCKCGAICVMMFICMFELKCFASLLFSQIQRVVPVFNQVAACAGRTTKLLASADA